MEELGKITTALIPDTFRNKNSQGSAKVLVIKTAAMESHAGSKRGMKTAAEKSYPDRESAGLRGLKDWGRQSIRVTNEEKKETYDITWGSEKLKNWNRLFKRGTARRGTSLPSKGQGKHKPGGENFHG